MSRGPIVINPRGIPSYALRRRVRYTNAPVPAIMVLPVVAEKPPVVETEPELTDESPIVIEDDEPIGIDSLTEEPKKTKGKGKGKAKVALEAPVANTAEVTVEPKLEAESATTGSAE